MQASPKVRRGCEMLSFSAFVFEFMFELEFALSRGLLVSLSLRRWRRVGRVVRMTHCLLATGS